MTKTKTRVSLTPDEKLYKAIQALFILQARQLDMGNEDIRKILRVDKSEVSAVAKLVNKAVKKYGKGTP
jgi:hypothetical protein